MVRPRGSTPTGARPTACSADDFTFSSAAGDDHISKSKFKAQCWETQLGFIEHFELEQVFGDGDDALVKYACRTKNGKSFAQLSSLFHFRDGKIASLEVLFRGAVELPTPAVSAGQKA